MISRFFSCSFGFIFLYLTFSALRHYIVLRSHGFYFTLINQYLTKPSIKYVIIDVVDKFLNNKINHVEDLDWLILVLLLNIIRKEKNIGASCPFQLVNFFFLNWLKSYCNIPDGKVPMSRTGRKWLPCGFSRRIWCF